MKKHGADVRDGTMRVRFDKDMILDYVAHARRNSRCMRATPRTMSALAGTI